MTPTIDLHPTETPLSAADREARLQSLGFGQTFTEHMVVIPYEEGSGWGRGVLQPYGPLSLDPATSVLHYGQAIFEGFKAYRQPDGGIKTFRAERNAERFQSISEAPRDGGAPTRDSSSPRPTRSSGRTATGSPRTRARASTCARS